MRRPVACIHPYLLLLCIPLAACDDDAGGQLLPIGDRGPVDVAPPDAAPPDAAPADLGGPDAGPEPAPLDRCLRTAPAMANDAPLPVQWSAAHALARYFGVHGGTAAVDEALVAAFAVDAAGDAPGYADDLPFVCALDAQAARPLGPAEVRLVDGVAYVRPGTGPVGIPDAATAVVLDLDGLPPTAGLTGALETASAAILAEPLSQIVEARVIEGLPDEVYSPQNLYRGIIGSVEMTWPGAAARAWPIAVAVGPRPAPAAARLAGAIRAANRGWLVGEPLMAAVAESEAVPIGDGGLSIRWATALDGEGEPWPDVLEADAPTVDAWLAGLADPVPPSPLQGAAERPRTQPFVPFDQVPPNTTGPAERRAMLVVAHGTLRRFFPYFDVVGDTIDDRLEETWATLDDDGPWDRGDSLNLLYRFGEAIQDGHNFIFDGLQRGGAAPIQVDHLEDERPVVRASASLAVRPGQIITTIDGVPAAEWYAAELPRTSAATRGYALDLASRRYLQGAEPLALGLEAIDGRIFEVELARGAFGGAPSSSPWRHPSGWLDAFEAAGVFYVNLAGDVESDEPDLIDRMQAALPDAEGLIIDMRGYPGLRTDRISIMAIGGMAFRSAIFDVPVWVGPQRLEISSSQYDAAAIGGRDAQDVPPFAGPVAVLMGPTAVSAAENFAMTLSQSDNVTVVGRRSAATNGNITGVRLPGAFGFTFTGMRVLFPDGALFHGVGIAPDIEVWPTAESLSEGRDRELEAAVGHVLGPR